MIRATRRNVLGAATLGMAAIPTVSGLAAWRWRHGDSRVLLHDAGLSGGERFAAAAQRHGTASTAITGDRVRFTRQILADRPALVAGVTRHADQLMIEDVAREQGYMRAALLHGKQGQCSGLECRQGWNGVGRIARHAGSDWIDALAEFAIAPAEAGAKALAQSAAQAVDPGLILGWVLVPRG
ncbi:hypothetical protein [Altericroceibacterium endophyticum]|uniref:Uncharacterized protein n=1 Tax=Altericroceibacterium endophyticum TaxID=1808508 RepID=A0A6I4T4D3_9SPHN|nr:hypothetical protein [Altericroceibacterium endophyticum]MXO65229.1 hypothetical protein [Altericroceibacterium endophyticum]